MLSFPYIITKNRCLIKFTQRKERKGKMSLPLGCCFKLIHKQLPRLSRALLKWTPISRFVTANNISLVEHFLQYSVTMIPDLSSPCEPVYRLVSARTVAESVASPELNFRAVRFECSKIERQFLNSNAEFYRKDQFIFFLFNNLVFSSFEFRTVFTNKWRWFSFSFFACGVGL